MTFIMTDSWEGLLSRDQNGSDYGRTRALRWAKSSIIMVAGSIVCQYHEMY